MMPADQQRSSNQQNATRQLRQYKVKVFDESTAALLETSIQTWLAEAGEKVYIEGHALAEYSFLILYAE